VKILLVEDSERLRKPLAKALGRLGHAVDQAEDGAAADALIDGIDYEVVIMDRMMPGRDGLEVLQGWRRKGIAVPILILTALNAVEEKVHCLLQGADDYLTKPFAFQELVARLEALARRNQTLREPVVEVGPLAVDFAAKAAFWEGAKIELTAREFSLLGFLARNRGRVMSRQQIENHLYDGDSSPLSNAVDSTVCVLRRKIFPPGVRSLIHTRRGLGYVLEP
jgi:two-component system copper resistance phosphate regulon response regulator CusR